MRCPNQLLQQRVAGSAGAGAAASPWAYLVLVVRRCSSLLMKRTILAFLLPASFLPCACSRDSEWAKAKLARQAPQTLRTARQFTIGKVGDAGSPAESEFSFRALLKRRDAVAECGKLTTTASPAGQLYGLLGLRLLDREAFDAASPRFKGSKVSVATMDGCSVFQTTVGAIAAEIAQGTIK